MFCEIMAEILYHK